MNNMEPREIERAIENLCIRVKRLEAVEVANGRIISHTSERAEGQSGGQQRRVDDLRVSPGEAEAATLRLIIEHCERAAERASGAREFWDAPKGGYIEVLSEGEQRAYEDVAYFASLLLPKPDSDADEANLTREELVELLRGTEEQRQSERKTRERYQKALEWCRDVNACDYEYRQIAAFALANADALAHGGSAALTSEQPR